MARPELSFADPVPCSEPRRGLLSRLWLLSCLLQGALGNYPRRPYHPSSFLLARFRAQLPSHTGSLLHPKCPSSLHLRPGPCLPLLSSVLASSSSPPPGSLLRSFCPQGTLSPLVSVRTSSHTYFLEIATFRQAHPISPNTLKSLMR